MGGVSEGQGQQGCGRSGRGVDRRVRTGSRQEPVPDLESYVVGKLLPTSGQSGGNSQSWRDGRAGARGADRGGSGRADGGQDAIFHPDSYGYRPKKSALDAVGTCRQRCWRADWVIDLDIKAFFDSVPWDLILKAVEHHTDQRWILLYVRRWLTAPIQQPDGVLVERDRGTPQGSAISPLLANLFMHYAFDAWMVREFPSIPFERYCDDVVVHCGSERQTRMVRDAIAARLAQVGLEMHPDKTRIVYCSVSRTRRGALCR